MKSGLALTAFPPPKLSLHSHGICTAVLREQKTQTGFFGARRWGAPLLCKVRTLSYGLRELAPGLAGMLRLAKDFQRRAFQLDAEVDLCHKVHRNGLKPKKKGCLDSRLDLFHRLRPKKA